MCALIAYRRYNRGGDLCNFSSDFKSFLPALQYLANFFFQPMVSQLLPTNSTQRDLPFISLGILDVQQRTVIGARDLHSHDRLVTGHELISDHLQVRFALRDDVLLGADLQ